MKGKGERERYTQLNAGFQRIIRRDKKAFLCDQCKEIEGNNRMGKTRDLFKKIRDTREHFMQRWAYKGQKWYGHHRSRRYSEELARIYRRTVQKKIFMTQIITV